MKSLFEESVYTEILERIDLLHENSERQWGKMTMGQMAWHCQFPLAIGIKNKDKGNGNFFVKLFFKKQMYNEKPFRKNLPTAPNLKATVPKDVTVEKAKLKELVCQFYECRSRTSWNPHPLFGKFTHQQWGQVQYKHLDHHLKQFGV